MSSRAVTDALLVRAPAVTGAAGRARTLENPLFIACGLSWITAIIHVQAAVEHVDEFVLYAVFFVMLAAAQCLWGMAVYRAPSRRLLAVGAALSVATATLWLMSRTTGLPIGPAPWSPEPAGALDSIATANEIAIALLLYPTLRRGASGSLARSLARATTAAALCLVLLSSLALVGGHAH